MVNLDSIRAARDRIADAIYHSPCPYSLQLSRLCGADVYCKLDHLQLTGSFKERGARNRLKQLTAPQRQAGVIAASAGNHALALAYHGRDLGLRVTVVMPRWAPLVKVSNCRALGANIILHGESYEEAKHHALDEAARLGMVFIHGFDDPEIIAGQGTMGLEILEDVPDVQAVIIPVGGGGLIAGVATAIKALRPEVHIIGVEPRNAPTMHESLQRGQVTRIQTQPTLADGLAIAEAGKIPFEICQRLVDQIVLVDEAQIAQSVLRLLELEKTVVEGAGAATLAAAEDPAMHLRGKKIVLALCGGNIDVTVIARVIERGLVAEGRLCRLRCGISDRPGSLARLLAVIAEKGGSIKEVTHDRNFGPADVSRVTVFCVVETRDSSHVDEIVAAVSASGIEVAKEER